jgi:hypothetical protein
MAVKSFISQIKNYDGIGQSKTKPMVGVKYFFGELSSAVSWF